MIDADGGHLDDPVLAAVSGLSDPRWVERVIGFWDYDHDAVEMDQDLWVDLGELRAAAARARLGRGSGSGT
jgi:hypothetical protein